MYRATRRPETAPNLSTIPFCQVCSSLSHLPASTNALSRQRFLGCLMTEGRTDWDSSLFSWRSWCWQSYPEVCRSDKMRVCKLLNTSPLRLAPPTYAPIKEHTHTHTFSHTQLWNICTITTALWLRSKTRAFFCARKATNSRNRPHTTGFPPKMNNFQYFLTTKPLTNNQLYTSQNALKLTAKYQTQLNYSNV